MPLMHSYFLVYPFIFGQMIDTSAPFSFRVFASCHTLLSKGKGRFSTMINMCFPSNMGFGLPVNAFIVLFLTDLLRQSYHINDRVFPLNIGQDIYVFFFF